MGRDITADKTPLLMAADQNIGNSAIIPPQVGTQGTVQAIMNPPRILQLTGGSAVAQSTSVVVTAARITGRDNPSPGFAGPLTGVVEFGNGGRSTKAEFDIPFGPYLGYPNSVLGSSEPQDGGVIISVPTGVLRVYARYDNLLVQPLISTVPPISLAQAKGVPFIGPGGLQDVLYPPAEPLLVKAMAAYFTRHYSRLFKTQYLYISYGPTPPVTVGTIFGPLIQPYTYAIPAFAQSVKVLRSPNTASLVIGLDDGASNNLEGITVPSGPAAPIQLTGTAVTLSVASASLGAADQIRFLALCYEIGI